MSPEKASCVLVADRHQEMAEGIRCMLGTLFETVMMVADPISLLEGARRLEPDVVVVDLPLAAGANLRLLRDLREQFPRLRIVALSAHADAVAREATLEAGADTFVLRQEIATELLPAVEGLLHRPSRESD